MEKWLTLFLSVLLSAACTAQSSAKKTFACDCSDKKVQDSLIEKYLENGAHKLPYSYNDKGWNLYCDSLIAVCPDIAYAYEQKAVPLIKYGDYEKAFALENKAAELDPVSYMAYRGFLKCIFTKDYEGALIDFTKAQQINPNDYEMDHTYFFWLGVSNLELGNFAKAEKNLMQDIFVQTNGDTTRTAHFNTLLYCGILYYESQNYLLAKQYLRGCLAQYKDHPNANYYMAMVYRQEKNAELEKEFLLKAKLAFEKGYTFSEDNVFYVNYPHQIRLYEVTQALNEVK